MQAAAGFLHALVADGVLERAPFAFPERYARATELARKRVRTFETTSVGRLFDTVAALLGFTREQTFEGQAAMWLEQLARRAAPVAAYPFPFAGASSTIGRCSMRSCATGSRAATSSEIAFAFHAAVAGAIVRASSALRSKRSSSVGGVFQNALLVELLHAALGERLLVNLRVPPNDGGICLGQAALAAVEIGRAAEAGCAR